MHADQNKPNEASSEGTTPRWLRIVMFTFLLGLAGMAATLILDHANRASLETTSENTAAGDTALYQIEKRPIDRVTQILTFDGQPLYFARLKHIGARDVEMQALGKEDSGRYTIYQSVDPALRVGPEGQPLYCVKVALKRYFPLQTYPGAPGMHEIPEKEWIAAKPEDVTAPAE